ncbi:hypothetical protein SHKM778_01490 [Streptomyces sp. KM77-8]|uniref:Cytochrome P450 n=1 Tax=Streptomyces haneummycinicus TaxID=3074435 RepID=A0AAT9H8N8_9ACTN
MRAPTLDELAPHGHDPAHDPYSVLAELRRKGPVHRVHVPGSGDAWLVVTREGVRAALTDPRLRNDIRHSATWETDGGHAVGRNMLQSDPPHHTRLRNLVAGHFTPGRIAALRPGIEAVAGDLLARLPRPGTADLVSGYASPLPVTVICDLLGVPETDRADFHTWSNELVTPTDEATAAASSAALAGYLTGLIAEKARTPDGALLADLATDTRTDAGELLGMAFLLLVAGHETTVDLISATVHSLLTHPDQLALLRADPALTGAAIEESLRFNSPFTRARSASRPSRWSWPEPGWRPVTRSSSPWPRPPATRSPSPTRTASTSPAAPRGIWPSVTASTTAWAPRWPARRPPSPSASSWTAIPAWHSPPIPPPSPGARAPSCAGSPHSRSNWAERCAAGETGRPGRRGDGKAGETGRREGRGDGETGRPGRAPSCTRGDATARPGLPSGRNLPCHGAGRPPGRPPA